MSLHLKYNCLQAVYNWVLLFIQYDNLSLLTEEFRLIYNWIIDMAGFKPTILLFSIILLDALGLKHI